MTPYLEVESLEVRYGRAPALVGVSFSVGRGAVLAVLGRNGAGKSSLLRAISGLVRPATGKVWWDGREVTRVPADRKVRLGMVMIPEGRRVFPNLSVRENLLLGGFVLPGGEIEAALERVFGLFPLLGERSEAPAGQLSGGQQQVLAIGRALMIDPKVMLLDEPSLGLAPKVIEEVYEELTRLRAEGMTILLVEQHVSRALRFADRALVLNLGEVVLEEDPAILVDDPRLVGAYMGEGVR